MLLNRMDHIIGRFIRAVTKHRRFSQACQFNLKSIDKIAHGKLMLGLDQRTTSLTWATRQSPSLPSGRGARIDNEAAFNYAHHLQLRRKRLQL
jgi:hypothetical protein